MTRVLLHLCLKNRKSAINPMQDYRQYKPTDFISDDSFRAWVLENSEEEPPFGNNGCY
jgi:hypothetical protein